ncbi:MAG TPA: hypothetical protein VLS45_00625 [Methylomicrobium sp.]|nr:hypothetical protein [Methylomicrobium sp.]
MNTIAALNESEEVILMARAVEIYSRLVTAQDEAKDDIVNLKAEFENRIDQKAMAAILKLAKAKASDKLLRLLSDVDRIKRIAEQLDLFA